jgi:hypothetical protein
MYPGPKIQAAGDTLTPVIFGSGRRLFENLRVNAY